MSDVEIVAYVLGWNMAPKGLAKTRHRLYYLDYNKGWVYLTGAGRKVYAQNKEEVDRIKREVHEPAVQAWAKQAVGTLVNDLH